MRIIDKNTDYYDYLQNIYRDDSLTFDRTDSFLLTKELFCDKLDIVYSGWMHDNHNYILLQICNTFWIFDAETIKATDWGKPLEYSLKLFTTWKNYNKPRCLIRLDRIRFSGWHVNYMFDRAVRKSDTDGAVEILKNAVDSNEFEVVQVINKHTIYKDDDVKIEKHIPLFKACGIADLIDPLDMFLIFEEYFSLEKSSIEKTESVGLTDIEKVGNHGFDTKTSFRGKCS